MTATLSVSRESASPDDGAPQVHTVTRRWLPWAVLALGLGLFSYGVTTIPSAGISEFGLLVVASPAYGVSVLLAAVGFGIAVRQANFQAAVAGTLLMIVGQRLPRTVTTDEPMYAWTYKHLGVVDYIQHAHHLARDVDIYNGWPGLFGLTAWFSDLTGISATSIAHWYTPLFHVVFALMAYAVARAWGLQPFGAITATFLVVMLNWVEQDYYSPQATAMIFAAAILAIVGLSRERPVATLPLMILFGAATITHELTPYWVLLVIGLLVVSRRMKPWWIVFPLAAMLAAFFFFNYHQVMHYQLFSFDLFKNARGNIPTKGVLGQQIAVYVVRTLSAAMWVATGLVLLARWRRKQPFWTLAVLSLSPMLIIGGANYGGEAVFRVFLYSLIGCSVVLGPALVNLLQGSTKQYLAALVALVLATAASVQGYTAAWYANVMPRVQVETSRMVLDQAELPAYLTAVAPLWPERSSWHYVDYARFNRWYDALMIDAHELARRHFDNDADYDAFLTALKYHPDASTYLIITNQMRVYSWYHGILPWDALPNLKERLKRDTEHWQPVYDGQGITVFVHTVHPGDHSNPLGGAVGAAHLAGAG